MNEQMTDKRLAEIDKYLHQRGFECAPDELLQALKAERERIAELEAENERLRTEGQHGR